jgi:Ca2+-binding EF-hand superfamily protein
MERPPLQEKPQPQQQPPPPPPPTPDDDDAQRPDNAMLDDVRVIQLARIFQFLDTDHDGLLDVDDARTLVAATGLPPTPAFLGRIDARLPPAWRGRGYDFDTLVGCIEERLAEDKVSLADVSELFHLFTPGAAPRPSHAGAGTPLPRAGGAAAAAGDTTVPAFTVRHLLSGIPTTHNTQLMDSEVTDLFADFGITGERDKVAYVQLLQQLAGGFSKFAP